MQPQDILCPGCGEPLPDSTCGRCARAFQRGPSGSSHLLDFIDTAQREARAAKVESFYTVSPFPGYSPDDNSASLLDRSRQSAFLRALDEGLPPNGEILDLGCGTGQTAMFLALAAPRRRVLGVDGCRASLDLAEAFRHRERVENLHLLRADLFDLPLEKQRYAAVVCRGVVHHTPDPARAIEEVAARVRPGGVLLLGFYETWARAFHRGRRGLSKIVGRPLTSLDPILRSRAITGEKKRIWADDQYRHPLEKILPLPWVLRELERCGLRPERAIPPLPVPAAMLEADSSTLGVRTRAGWAISGVTDPDAGLICVVARRP